MDSSVDDVKDTMIQRAVDIEQLLQRDPGPNLTAWRSHLSAQLTHGRKLLEENPAVDPIFRNRLADAIQWGTARWLNVVGQHSRESRGGLQ